VKFILFTALRLSYCPGASREGGSWEGEGNLTPVHSQRLEEVNKVVKGVKSSIIRLQPERRLVQDEV